MLAKYETDDELQRIMALIKQTNKHKIQKLSAPWREKLSTFSPVSNGYLYMDDRLVIPKALRMASQRCFYWEHRGSNETLHKSSETLHKSTGMSCSLSRCAWNVRMQVKTFKPFDHKVNMENCPMLKMLLMKFLSILRDRSN